MSTTNNSQSRPNKYGDGSNDESSSSSSSFSNNQDDQEHPVALGGFINFLKAHIGHFYLPPYADDVINPHFITTRHVKDPTLGNSLQIKFTTSGLAHFFIEAIFGILDYVGALWNLPTVDHVFLDWLKMDPLGNLEAKVVQLANWGSILSARDLLCLHPSSICSWPIPRKPLASLIGACCKRCPIFKGLPFYLSQANDYVKLDPIA
ncbi:hypothetical protein JHK87_018812 [Glycine soja]|nr:hypothetical protein JHK87_018812 [Glycine soja]